MRQRGQDAALVAIGDMYQGQIVDLTAPIALQAAKLSVELKIAMADSLILATAHAYNAVIWTQDVDYEGRRGCRVHPEEVIIQVYKRIFGLINHQREAFAR